MTLLLFLLNHNDSVAYFKSLTVFVTLEYFVLCKAFVNIDSFNTFIALKMFQV